MGNAQIEVTLNSKVLPIDLKEARAHMRRRGTGILELQISGAQMLVATFAMSNGDCLEGRHSVKEPLILGQL